MAQPTTTQGAQFRPVKINYGAIAQNHVRYMRKYKDEQEAKEYAKKANEREFQRKISKDREKLTPEINVGDAQGYWRHERIRVFEEEERELSALKQDFKNTGSREAKLKYDNRRRYYNNLNSLTESSSNFLKYINDNKKDYNEDLDSGLVDLATSLQKSNYKLNRKGVQIPANDGILELFGLSNKDQDKDGFITIPPEVLSEKFINSGKYSGKADFDGIGTSISTELKLDDINGNIELTPSKENQAIRSWRGELLSNDVLAKTYAKRNGVDLNNLSKDELGVFLDSSAIKLANEYTLRKIKTKDNSLANNLKIQSNFRANKASNKTNSENTQAQETVSLATDASGAILTKDGNEGIVGGVGPRNENYEYITNLPKPVTYGSPTSKGVVKVEQVRKTDDGKWSATGFKLVESPTGEVVFGETKYKVTSERVEITKQEDLNAIVKKVKTGKNKVDQFDNLGEFDKFVKSLSQETVEKKETNEERKKRLGLK